jgi:hypothetical protein
VDNSHANKLTVHILAAVPQHEQEMIWERNQGPAPNSPGASICDRLYASRVFTCQPKGNNPLRVAGWFAADDGGRAISASVAANGVRSTQADLRSAI